MRFRPIHMGLLASLVAAAGVLFAPEGWLEAGREFYFDRLTQIFPIAQSDDIAVIDLDAKAYAAAPDRNWTRAETAKLIGMVAAEHPALIGSDLVFSSQCAPDLAENRALAAALKSTTSILGFLYSDAPSTPPHPAPPLAITRSVTVPEIWFFPGAETPCPMFQDVASAAAGSFLIGDEDGRVRRAQAYSILGPNPYPALGVEAARLFLKIKTPILGGTPPWLKLGKNRYSLAEDGSLRLIASNRAAIVTRTVSAADVIAKKPPGDFFAGKIVLIGSSLPNNGGLRSSAAEPLVASVQLHADLANELLAGFVPTRDDVMVNVEASLVLAIGLVIALMTVRFRPSLIALSGFALMALAIAASAVLYVQYALLMDGFTVTLALALVLSAASFSQFAETRRAERMARRRFSQYLPQSVVDRYIDAPGGRSMVEDERQVTAMFTDIEGFSSLAGRVSPRVLVSLLNVYFAEVTRLVSDHGGMVDKIVGDAVHAFFNAPEDLADHVNKAIACALAITHLVEEMRRRPDFLAQDFGRTRIGIETGMAVLGEVGIGGKLDYTAHGNAINLAARLQDANKFLGTTICIGPDAAKESTTALRPLGEHEIRGFGTMPLFTADDLLSASGSQNGQPPLRL